MDGPLWLPRERLDREDQQGTMQPSTGRSAALGVRGDSSRRLRER